MRRFAFFFLAAILALAGCTKESNPPVKGHLEVSAYAPNSTENTSVTIIQDGNKIIPSWERGDVIKGFWKDGNSVKPLSYKVKSVSAEGLASFELLSGTEPTADGTEVYMIHSGGNCCSDFGSDGKAQASLLRQSGSFEGLRENFIFCAQQKIQDKKLRFTFRAATAIIDLKKILGTGNETITSITISGKGIARGTVSIADNTLQPCAGQAYDAVTINFQNGHGADTPVWITLLPQDNAAVTFTVHTSSDTYDKSLTRSFGRGKLVNVNSMTVGPITLSGEFTVNENGDKVRFTRGNLIATRCGSVIGWIFAARQNDCPTTGVTDMNADGCFQHFCWSSTATGNNWGLLPALADDDSSPEYLGAFNDWGKNFGSGYRTLSKAEWDYILTKRSGNDRNDRFLKSTVDGVPGLLLFPDSFSWPEGTKRPTSGMNYDKAPFTGNDNNEGIFDAAQFAALQAAGAVFLPAAGLRREGDNVILEDSKGRFGWYRSSSSKSNTQSQTLYFNSSSLTNGYRDNVYDVCKGLSVRLVKTVD